MTHKKITNGHKKSTSAKREPTEFGENLLRARKELLFWTRVELRNKSKEFFPKGVSENTISNIELGDSPGRLEIISALKETITKALGCPYPWKEDGDLLNENSLEKLIKDSHLVNELDQEIAALHKVRLILPDSYIGLILERISHVGIKKISEIKHLLGEHKQAIKKFAAACYKHPILRQTHLPRGVCVSSLQILLLLQKGKTKMLQDFLKENRLNQNVDASKMTRALKIAFKEVQK